MSARIAYPGIKHGDRVKLTGSSWGEGRFDTSVEYVVDDETFHRPAIYADITPGNPVEWYIMEPIRDYGDWSVTKVEA
ncbi:hypothetical protein SEA_PAVLO_104 [Microbacterium phage Pavlo]|nr:hypothetical protein LUPINE_102 [Microbacterium phage Lupine]QDK03346.1 hypothetical protein SEA_ROMAN_105 [Microbacterium phage Roman]QIG58648.1 hypothetical protein SEA_HUBBS_103 [Microbacterium phage Hubbs]UVG34160.1 hypothetical protein SEA_PAVLO_104 [Microbacterium phage Pavlo]